MSASEIFHCVDQPGLRFASCGYACCANRLTMVPKHPPPERGRSVCASKPGGGQSLRMTLPKRPPPQPSPFQGEGVSLARMSVASRMFPTCAIDHGRTREHPSAQVGCIRLAPLIMAELGNTRVLRTCGILLCVNDPDCAQRNPGYACFNVPSDAMQSTSAMNCASGGVAGNAAP